jgi:Uma2 family endonuclease
MATARTHLSYEEFLQLPDDGQRYELDEGELLVVPSPAPRHNLIRHRIADALLKFVKAKGLGIVIEEMDFRLGPGPELVRNPDIAFVTKSMEIDLDRSPIEGAPTLAVEVISPSNTATDTVKKMHQYLDAGVLSVWLVYPKLRLVEIHSVQDGQPKRRDIREPEVLNDPTVLPGFAIPLPDIFDNLV